MTTKAVRRRMMHGLVGSQRWLPGLACDHEYKLRTAIANHFEPRDFIEGMWVVDIAYCSASIELIRCRITAVQRLQMHSALARTQGAFGTGLPGVSDPEASIAYLKSVADRHFRDELLKQFYDTSAAFALLGLASDESAVSLLRDLQLIEHQEMRERDRLINQIHRSRRQAMRDAIELVEAKSRADGELDDLVGPYSGPENSGGATDLDGNEQENPTDSADIDADRVAEDIPA